MANIFQNIAVIAVGSVLGLFGMKANLVQAAIITSDFDVNITSGPLVGETFSGFVSYDNTDDSGRPFFTANDIEFTFNGTTFTEENSTVSVVIDREGTIAGLNYSVSDPASNNAFSFSPNPDSFPAGTGTFIYGIPMSGVFQVIGAGDTVFSSRIPPTPVFPITYTFKVEGFSGGGTLSGSFEGIDLNNDEYLEGDNKINGIEVFEITNFLAEFTGDSLVPDLTFEQEELFFQAGWRFLADGTLALDFFDMGSSEGFLFTSGEQIIVQDTEGKQSVASLGEVTASAIPEPTSTLGLLVLGCGALLKRKHSKKQKEI